MIVGHLDSAHEFGDAEFETLSEYVERVETRLFRAVLQGVQECRIQPRIFGQVGERSSALFTQIPEPSPETLVRSEEHTSELQSRGHLVCRLLLEKKKNKT